MAATLRSMSVSSFDVVINMLKISEVLFDFRDYAHLPDDFEVSIGTRSATGETPLHWMATLGDGAAIQLLTEEGADLNAQDEDGNSPMHAAVVSRQTIAVKLLIAAGAKVDLSNKAGLTPINVAELDGFRPILDALGCLS